jgi:hypothetical protein
MHPEPDNWIISCEFINVRGNKIGNGSSPNQVLIPASASNDNTRVHLKIAQALTGMSYKCRIMLPISSISGRLQSNTSYHGGLDGRGTAHVRAAK